MQVIVTTTIHPVTEAIQRFQALDNWHLIVVGDQKTPADYHLERGTYVSCEDQEKKDKELSQAIGWNCIQRRNFGLLWAKDMRADIVAVVDDDNIPYEGWGRILLVGRNVEANYYITDLAAFDPVGVTNEAALSASGIPPATGFQREAIARRKEGRCVPISRRISGMAIRISTRFAGWSIGRSADLIRNGFRSRVTECPRSIPRTRSCVPPS